MKLFYFSAEAQILIFLKKSRLCYVNINRNNNNDNNIHFKSPNFPSFFIPSYILSFSFNLFDGIVILS